MECPLPTNDRDFTFMRLLDTSICRYDYYVDLLVILFVIHGYDKKCASIPNFITVKYLQYVANHLYRKG